MTIVIDKALVDDYVHTLDEYRQLVHQYSNKLIEAEKKADENTLFTIVQARNYLGGISEEKLINFRKKGLAYYKKGKDGVWYRKGDIDEWIASGKVATRKSIH